MTCLRDRAPRKTPGGDFSTRWTNWARGIDLSFWAGRYHGPLIIGRRSGTSDSPIEVLFTKDAILVGASEAGTCDTPVLQAEGEHWHLFDLTLTPQFCPSGLRVVEPAKHVDLFSPHIYGGVGMGVVVESGASEVNIFEPHLHHLANLEGRDSEGSNKLGLRA